MGKLCTATHAHIRFFVGIYFCHTSIYRAIFADSNRCDGHPVDFAMDILDLVTVVIKDENGC